MHNNSIHASGVFPPLFLDVAGVTPYFNKCDWRIMVTLISITEREVFPMTAIKSDKWNSYYTVFLNNNSH